MAVRKTEENKTEKKVTAAKAAPKAAAKPAAKAAPKAAAKPAAKAAPKAAAKPAAKAAPKAAKKPEMIIQSPVGGNITPEEILAKVGKADKIYIRVDENKAYWVRGNETGSVDLWD